MGARPAKGVARLTLLETTDTESAHYESSSHAGPAAGAVGERMKGAMLGLQPTAVRGRRMRQAAKGPIS